MSVNGPYCHDCPHRDLGVRFIEPDGSGTSGLLIIGDSPWIDEIRLGRNFSGAAGGMLDRQLQLVNIQRGDVTVANTIWCFPGDAIVQAEGVKKAYRRLYEGPVIRVDTLRGHLIGTPNHPVFTQRGRVALSQLNDGDSLVYGGFEEDFASWNPYPKCRPSKFKELFGALAASSASHRAVGSVVDFHGDGIDGKVDIVTLDRILWDSADSSTLEGAKRFLLKLANQLVGLSKGLGAVLHDFPNTLWRNFGTLCDGVGCCRHPSYPFGTYLAHTSVSPLAGISRLDSCFPQSSVGFQHANMESLTKRSERFATPVTLDKIFRISHSEFSGHVYNLETSSGRYTINGYLVSNCKPLRLSWMDYPNRYKDANDAIEHCRPNLDDLIERMRPKVIVPLGNVALRRVCGVSGIEAHAGYVVPTPYGVPAVPTYHPAFVQRGQQKLNAAVLFALNRARSIANGTYQPTHYDLLLDPPPDVARAYLRSGGDRIPALIVDIETPESDRLDEEEIEQEGASWTIVRAGFSLRKGTAISFPWSEPYISILQEALDAADEMIERADNHFDAAVFRAAGLRLPARIVSGMWAWHWLESRSAQGAGSSGTLLLRWASLEDQVAVPSRLLQRYGQRRDDGRIPGNEGHPGQGWPVGCVRAPLHPSR